MNEWKRIGIVASVAWALGAYSHTFDAQRNHDMWFARKITETCIAANHGEEIGDSECLKRGERWAENSFSAARQKAAITALLPIPLGWGFVYLFLSTVRWVRQGFE
jgi:hypothetical protein